MKRKIKHRVAGVGISENAKTGITGVAFLAALAALFIVYKK